MAEWLYVEVKIEAGISDAQKTYADFILAPQAYFFRLPNNFLPQKRIAWETIHGLLADSLLDESLTQDSILGFVMAQFAEFLAEKGLKSIIMKTDAYDINSMTSVSSLFNEWTDLLNSFRSSLGLKKRGNLPPRWDQPTDTNGCSFYGIYGGESLYAGFEISPNGSVSCYYQEAFSGEL
ncbi:MAG: hypothetical protein WC657_09115, partial [Candidatus Paceibacterota bacterium]